MKNPYGFPWKRGIGEDCHKIWDCNGKLVAVVESPNDGTLIVQSVNAYEKRRKTEIEKNA